MFSNGGLRGSDRACLAEVMVTLLLITSSSLSSNPIFLSSIHQTHKGKSSVISTNGRNLS
jgi:hypothetical protein